MTKKTWAKGRNKQCFVNVSFETRELARKLALNERMTIKDLIYDALLGHQVDKALYKDVMQDLKR